jgi:hypothetical protein
MIDFTFPEKFYKNKISKKQLKSKATRKQYFNIDKIKRYHRYKLNTKFSFLFRKI